MLSNVRSCTILGIDGIVVSVETDIRPGLPSFCIVGLPESAVRESRERVSAAIVNSGYDFPLKRITVNLAPADIRKSGTAFDLAIAIGILSATGCVSADRLHGFAIIGELALDGSLRGVRGVLSMTLGAKQAGLGGIVAPHANGQEAAIVPGVEVIAPRHLTEAVSFFNTGDGADRLAGEAGEVAGETNVPRYEIDMSDIRGQEMVKRALEVACAGGHNVLMIGPPGSGKTMLSRRIPTVLPPLNLEEQIETTRVHSVSGTLPNATPLLLERPFRAPHHTISDAGLVGGGMVPRPGEVSLAHNGVLFLDELPEFRRSALEVMRQPLEDGYVHIARANFTAIYPARFMLVAAMNPCPCGYFTDTRRMCTCSSSDIQKYHSKISGPLLDRIDIHIEVPSVKVGDLIGVNRSEPSETIRKRIEDARKIQLVRFEHGWKQYCNAHMSASEARMKSDLHRDSLRFLKEAMHTLRLSARGFHRIIKVARTIADLEGDEQVNTHHVAEAVQYRTLDRTPQRHTF